MMTWGRPAVPHINAAPHKKIDYNEGIAKRFGEAMDDDFNTPEAISVLFELANEINRSRSAEHAQLLRSLAAVLGLLEREPEAFLQAGSDAGISPAEIEAHIEARKAARKNRDFAQADRIRDDLLDQGVVLEDGPTGTTWRRT